MSSLRFKVLSAAFKRKAVEVKTPSNKTSEYFAEYVFNKTAMGKYLSKETLNALAEAIDDGKPLERETADQVAAGMKTWAMELGATHYSHWFQPLTDGTAEKHESFVEHDEKGGIIEKFSGTLLTLQEPDASSFPSGGIRNTFEARGYTAWDPSSPAFILDGTLCIPTVFISYTGEALDYKTPLLKSMQVLNKNATEVCKYFDKNVKKVYAYLGIEQEYFLVDEALWAARPDLMLTGRTLMGHESARNQQLEDHYFGAIPTRVSAFMRDLEYEAYKLGIPVKTRHNEVAPNQFELVPIFEEMNLANDHNLLLMLLMEKIARSHNFKVILHEKPFKGVNGSGKHNNWSIGTDTGVKLLAPGKTSDENLQFITFLVNVLMAVYRNDALLKASISSASNADRLGANEAPPAIMSVFLGSQISEILDKLEFGNGEGTIKVDGKVGLKLALSHIPELLIDNTDRNRTSPFAFTGNRFEFRAVGSSANCASAMIVLNTAIAHQLGEFKKDVDTLIAEGSTKEQAIFSVLRNYLNISKPIRFDGNSYSEEWRKEAELRGLDCETNVPLIYDAYLSPKSVELFTKMGVLTKTELQARNEVKWEIYTKKIQIEARVLGDLATNHITPVANRYQNLLLSNVSKTMQIFPKDKAEKIAKQNIEAIENIAENLSCIKSNVAKMVDARRAANKIENEREKALAYHNTVTPFLEKTRHYIDNLELMVDDEMWPLPKYRELLFIR